MSLKVELFPRASADLERQYGWYVKHAGVEVAERYREAVDASVKTLASFPGLGIACNMKIPRLVDVRYYPVESPFEVHLVFYRADDMTLHVVRVMHGARDLPRRM